MDEVIIAENPEPLLGILAVMLIVKLAREGARYLMIVLLLIFGSPSEKELRKENSKLQAQYNVLSRRLDEAMGVLQDIQQRDDNLYRVIFMADPIPSAWTRILDKAENPDTGGNVHDYERWVVDGFYKDYGVKIGKVLVDMCWNKDNGHDGRGTVRVVVVDDTYGPLDTFTCSVISASMPKP